MLIASAVFGELPVLPLLPLVPASRGAMHPLADLVAGWRTLAQASQQEEEPATTQRRVTCGELATMAAQFTTERGNRAQAVKTWRIWRDVFQKSDDPDSRQAAMTKTFARELTDYKQPCSRRGLFLAPLRACSRNRMR